MTSLSLDSSDCENNLNSSQEASEDDSVNSGVKDIFEDVCDELKLEGSVFDASIVTPLWRKRRTTRIRVWFWAFLSFCLQFGTGVFLYKQLDETLSPEPDFFSPADHPATGCSWVSAADARGSGLFDVSGTLPEKSLVCVNKHILQMRNFGVLDGNADGRWTFNEARSLGGDLPKIYLKLMSLLEEVAQTVATFPCAAGDVVDAYIDFKGNAYTVRIIGQQVTAGAGVIVRQLDTHEVFKVDMHHLYKRDEYTACCRVAPCIDIDFGRTDKGGGPCSWYFYEGTKNGQDIYKAKAGAYDDDDFVAREMCCYLGGGSSSANNTQFQKLPINLALQDALHVQEFHNCTLYENKNECLAKHSFVPAEFFEQEIAPLMDLCMILDPDICGNVISRRAWPQVYPDNHMTAWIQRMLRNVTVPLFLRISKDMSHFSDVHALAMCTSIVRDFCPSLFPEYNMWNAERLQTCGASSTAMGKRAAVTTYAKSDLYNGPLAVRSRLFQAFLAWIVLLWAMAMLPEFRQLCLWWEAFLGLPRAQAGQESVAKVGGGQGAQYALVALPRWYRVVVAMLILVPQTLLLVFLYILGIQYLFVVRDISDLILNSLALTFLITIDDMLFLAFGDAYSKHLIDNMQTVQRDDSWSCLSTCMRRLHRCNVPLGLALFCPMLLVVLGLFMAEVSQVGAMGDLLNCWCEAAGDSCFAAQALGGDLVHNPMY